jgi:hypothetical protein
MLKLMPKRWASWLPVSRREGDVRDDIGDCLVVLNNLAVMSGTTLEECLGISYYSIRDRKGFLNGNGVFIKDSEVMR